MSLGRLRIYGLVNVLRSLSRTRLAGWLILSMMLDVLQFSSWSGGAWNANEIVTFSVKLISSTFEIAVLFFLGAAILFSTSSSKSRMELEDQWLAQRFVILLLLTTLYLAVLTLSVYLTLLQFGEPGVIVEMAYVVGAIIAAPVMSFIFCSLAAALTVTVDDWRMSFLIGCSLSLIINMSIGPPFLDAQYPEISLFSPSHFFRAIVVTISGLFTIVPLSIRLQMGLYSYMPLVVPALFYAAASATSLWIVRTLGRENLKRKRVVDKLKGADMMTVTVKEQSEMARLTRFLKRRRQAVLTSALILVLVVPVGGVTYRLNSRYDRRMVVYESPASGLSLSNGTVVYGTFMAEAPPPEIARFIGFQLEVLDWGQCPDQIQFERAFGVGSINDFLAMSETERWQFSRMTEIDQGQTSYGHDTWARVFDTSALHYWAFRLYSNEWIEGHGSIHVSISVLLRDIPSPD
ncbi:MAG: hypothetical protein ACFFER_13525 [Candidatus Thorarchaeota archaeon]